MRARQFVVTVGIFAAAAALMIGCNKEAAKQPSENAPSESTGKGDQPKAQETDEQQSTAPLRVLSGRKEALVGPLFEAFTKATGIKVEIEYGKTPALAMQMITEGNDSPADVFYAQESGYLGAMAKAGLLTTLPDTLSAQVRKELNGGQTAWLAISGRARVLVYDPAKVTAAALPKSLTDLTGERWKGKLGWAPGNGSFQAHLSAVRHHWGDAKVEAWLTAIKANDVRANKNNSSLVRDVAQGAIEAALVNHYYVHKLKLTDTVKTHSFTTDDASNVVMISGAGILKHSKEQSNALKLLEFLVSEPAQKILAETNFEYPAKKDMRVNSAVAPLSQVKMIAVPQDHLTDIGPTLKLLQKLELQ